MCAEMLEHPMRSGCAKIRKSTVAQYTKIHRGRYSRKEIPETYCATGCSANWLRNVGLPVLCDYAVRSVQLERHESYINCSG
jgi:hypothetical protein